MTVSNEKLLKMAEQITANMAYTDDRDVVAASVADHLGRFWDPRMLAGLKAYTADNPESVSPVLSAAVASLR
jgi:formate dehydrogenase subunit delta